ncbi:uncharacterized protein LOC128514361 [Clarias gariepinus]|uniref:uncharacterized protein LOC128514361 n=1 Tax=Clarias gariepinus TaxID=13013 RepID=UPI00234DCD7D|nr:uncharacterized protein LOC128514361 [Clarias gariepinus]
MKFCIFFSFLLTDYVNSAQSDSPAFQNMTAVQVSRSGTEGTDIILLCENDEKGSWSKRTEDGRVDLYILRNNEDTTVYKRAPDDRYTVLPDSTLMIKSLSLSDSGIYYCNGYPVLNLTVAPSSAAFSQSRTEGRNIRLPCDSDGEVSWTKHTEQDKKVLFIFHKENQDAYICEPDPDKRYITLPDSSLIIKNAVVSDSGLYRCGGDLFINLTVSPSKVLSKPLVHTYMSSMREPTGKM